MLRFAIASCIIVLSAAGSASAGLWDAMTVSYPTSHTHISSEYVAAMGAAGCGCSTGGCNGGGHYHCDQHSYGCAANLWSNYCSSLNSGGCHAKMHTRYHWFSRPSIGYYGPASCGCQAETAMPCCDQYPNCGCHHGRMIKGCGAACPNCLGMHLRGFWNSCNSCGAAACPRCGDNTEIINLEQSMQEQAPAITPAQPTPAKVEAKEARLIPALQNLLPIN
ncbi:hypothetical protein GC197_07470 [bacterium]|nr:hypothetical protein [bacterium]